MLQSWLRLPPDKAAGVVEQAELFHDELDLEQSYPLEFVAFRLTGFRRDLGDAALLVGTPLAHDLRWIIDRLTRLIDGLALPGTFRTLPEWSDELGVHPRTLNRWRDEGLRWRWTRDPQTRRRRIGHTVEALAAFERRFPGRVRRQGRAKPMSPAEREAALRRAEELAREQPERSLSAVAQQVARELGRAHETVRQCLLKQNQADSNKQPTETGLPKPRPKLTPERFRELRRRRRQGESLQSLADAFGRSVPTLHRLLLTDRAKVLRRLPLDAVQSRLFERPDAAEVFLRESTGHDSTPNATPADDRLVEGLPSWARIALNATPSPGPDARRALFLRMNFLKHRAGRAVQDLPKDAMLRSKTLAAIEADVRAAGQARKRLVAAEGLALLSLVRRQAMGVGPAELAFVERLGSAWHVLVGAVDTYNASGNIRFETYLRNRVQRALAQAETEAVARHQDADPHGSTDHDEPTRASRRGAPSPVESAWEQFALELGRWVPVDLHPTPHDQSGPA